MTTLALGSAVAEIFLFAMGCLMLLAATFRCQARILLYITVATFLFAALLVWQIAPASKSLTYFGLFEVSLLASTLKVGILLSCAAVMAYSGKYLEERGMLNGEYLSLGIFATCGMMLLAAASHFLTLYLGLELMSLSMYAMIAMRRGHGPAIESAMKYFVLGALSSGLLLYGISMIYAGTGELGFAAVTAKISATEGLSGVLVLGLVFMMAGVAFKLGAAPFHMWLPDVYDGAPTAVTLFIGSAPKITAFALAIRILTEAAQPLVADWSGMLVVMSVASLAVGNITAIAQTKIKRMLAYSAISHMGFMLIGLVAATELGYASALFYTFTYALMTIGGFGMLVLLSHAGFEAETFDDVRGLATRNGVAAALMLVLMLSMAGIPPLVGFYAKLAVWNAAVASGWTWLAIVAAVFSMIGAFYYLRVIKLMYFDEAPANAPKRSPISTPYLLLASANGLLVIGLGILPGGLMAVCLRAFGIN